MGSAWKATCLAVVLALVVPAFADDMGDVEELSVEAIVISFRSADNKDSAAIDKAVIAPLRKAYADQSVLFLDVDLSNKASAHQGRLLLTATGLSPLWATHGKKPGSALIWDPYNERVALGVTPATKIADATASLKRVLSASAAEEEEDEDGDMDDDDGES